MHEIYYMIGLSYIELYQFFPAFDNFNKAKMLKPTEKAYYLYSGICAENIADYDAASANYSIALNLDSLYIPVYMNRSTLEYERPNPDYSLIIRDVNTIQKLDSTKMTSYYYMVRGYAKTNLKYYKEGRLDYISAINKDYNIFKTWFLYKENFLKDFEDPKTNVTYKKNYISAAQTYADK